LSPLPINAFLKIQFTHAIDPIWAFDQTKSHFLVAQLALLAISSGALGNLKWRI
jgi:lipoprotein signal peptidase